MQGSFATGAAPYVVSVRFSLYNRAAKHDPSSDGALQGARFRMAREIEGTPGA